MTTFLPYQDFRSSALALDNQRLGKQRIEVLQLAKCIAYDSKGWKNHPATAMWRPYLDCLIYYGMTCCKVWQGKGFKDTVWTDLYMMLEVPYDEGMKNVPYPPWLGSHRLHSSHRSRLLMKDLGFYRKHSWEETPSERYFWPAANYDWRAAKDDRADRYIDFGVPSS